MSGLPTHEAAFVRCGRSPIGANESALAAWDVWRARHASPIRLADREIPARGIRRPHEYLAPARHSLGLWQSVSIQTSKQSFPPKNDAVNYARPR